MDNLSEEENRVKDRIPNSNNTQTTHRNTTTSSNGDNKSDKSKNKSFENIKPADATVRIVHLSEENLLLRQTLRKLEEKVKLLATKLVRQLGDRKTKDKRTAKLVEDQKEKIIELEQDNDHLKDRLQVLRQQLTSYTKLIPHVTHPSHHPHPSSARLSSAAKGTKSKKSVTGSNIGGDGLLGDREFTSRVEQLLLEAKAENQALEDQLRVTRDRLSTSERELSSAQRALKESNLSNQEELLCLRSQLDVENERLKKKKQLSDNIQLIKLQRESRRTSSWLSTMETQRQTLESQLNCANETVAQCESQLASMQEELRLEQEKSLGLQKSFEDCESQLSRFKELEAVVSGLQEENRILKHVNESFVQKTLSSERIVGSGSGIGHNPGQWGGSSGVGPTVNLDEIRELKTQLAQLESILKVELKNKAELLQSLNQEKAKTLLKEEKISQLEVKFKELETNSAATSMRNSSNTAACQIAATAASQELDQELAQTQWQLVQVRDELDKTRSLLRTQMTINKDYQREIEALTQKLDKSESFHHEKLQEFMKIMEQRAEQMSLLEKTLETIHLNTCNHNKTTPNANFTLNSLNLVQGSLQEAPTFTSSKDEDTKETVNA